MLPTTLKTKIITARLVETRDFYQRCFGMVMAEEWDEADDTGCILAFPGGSEEALLEIYQGPQPEDFSGLSLQFRTADLDDFVSRLPPDVATRGPTRRPWGSTYLYMTDPNGIAIVVYEGGY